MKLRLLIVAAFIFLNIDSFAQFEKKSLHATVTLSSYFKYGVMISYFPIKNLELGIGSSFQSLGTEKNLFASNINKNRWAIQYKMNYYLSNWIIKPKIVGSLAFIKTNMGTEDTYSSNPPLPLKYNSYNAALGIGLSARLNNRIRLEGDINYNKFAFKSVKGSSPYIREEIYPSKYALSATLSYQITKPK